MRILDLELEELKKRLMDMVDLVYGQLEDVALALTTHDYEIARRIRKTEKKIDKLDLKIDKRCERILVLHQPVANDLRYVVTILKINSFLEQIGDISTGIARKIIEIKTPIEAEFVTDLRLTEMVGLTRSLLAESISSFIKENSENSRTINQKDDLIDKIHRESFDKFTVAMQTHPDRIADYLQLFLIMRGLEKIADFAVDISQESVFSVEGVFYRHTKEMFGVPASDEIKETKAE